MNKHKFICHRLYRKQKHQVYCNLPELFENGKLIEFSKIKRDIFYRASFYTNSLWEPILLDF